MSQSIITNKGKEKIIKARAGVNVTVPAIVGMAFGDGAISGGTPRTPLPTDTALQHQLLRQAIDSVTVQPDNISAVYLCTLAEATLAGEVINEIGLYDSDGDIVAIKVFDSDKGKDGDMKMEFTVKDKFTD